MTATLINNFTDLIIEIVNATDEYTATLETDLIAKVKFQKKSYEGQKCTV